MVRHSQFLVAPKAGASRWCTDGSVQSWQQLVAAGRWAAHGEVAAIMLLEILGHLLKLVEVVGDEGPKSVRGDWGLSTSTMVSSASKVHKCNLECNTASPSENLLSERLQIHPVSTSAIGKGNSYQNIPPFQFSLERAASNS
uniref:Uncharacterized protein n=1 Tax=Chromera velia CCMP2878 TaxID=1169474 RepID=A0A0G4HLS0_9ALVE|eukprot:Cvel_7460.t1-p1 / transcript=Cvel_7460.t1 / gene=Cvel_7460 / organism=Chromera_velia_CCMP2878 / gene_product=hypothetical protein / transcript_product=hypothetical protein / location=Cvel_scaffold390:76991-77413(+) / protein_length=141 / sequence_SO=supercontig / SO=protein_coding / is_pseudo=false